MILVVKMSYNLLVLVIMVINLNVVQVAVYIPDAYRKLMYQKDMSQYCRRNVIPSVFLGRQVIGAYSQLLYFSRLEVPYSCFINVRTEMGSKIIVVIQITNDVDLKESCNEGASQLFIHEMQETFGGYWGPIPDTLMKPHKERKHNSYTLRPKTTLLPSRITSITSSSTTQDSHKNESAKEMSAEDEQQQQEYLTIELPIVNVSVEIITETLPYISQSNIYPSQDKSNLRFGATTWREFSYETQIKPMDDLNKIKSGQVGDSNIYRVNYNPEMQLQFNNWFTYDPRLTFPTVSSRNFRRLYKYQPIMNKLLNFKNNKVYFVPKAFNRTFPLTQFRSHITPANIYLSKLYETIQLTTNAFENQEEIKLDSWEAVYKMLQKLSDNNATLTEAPHHELAHILRRIANTENNQSVYLARNLISSENSAILHFSEYMQESSTKTQPRQDPTSYTVSSSRNHLNKSFEGNIKSSNLSRVLNFNNSEVNENNSIVRLLPLPVDVDNIILTVLNDNSNNKTKKDIMSKTTLDATNTTPAKKLVSLSTKTVSLVDHKSWENVVKVAPSMAVKLNQTHEISAEEKQETNVTKPRQSKIRKKRYMHAIDIEIAKPQKINMMRHTSSIQEPVVLDMRDFQSLIEMQEYEMHGRVSLQNLRPYIGPPLLNICTLNMSASRHVYLFNSSRIVLAISNFTLKHMTLVLTPARTLRDIDTRCPPHNLECQIYGARVCVDSLTACDGVPNCGSYDIYDEDRLQCDESSGLRHNVCLAAITVLAVVLTVLYTIHYWLSRCVPKVSDAFFIYTDAAENVLHLETIMRSPQDIGYGKNFYHHEENQELDSINVEDNENFCKRLVNRFVLFLQCRRKKVSQDIDAIERIDELSKDSKKLSSFAKTEIDKMALDVPFMSSISETGVQTENDFDKAEISHTDSKQKKKSIDNIVRTSRDASDLTKYDSELSQASNELLMLKFFKGLRPRSISIQLNPMDDILPSQLSTVQLLDISKHDQNNFNPNICKMEEETVVPESMPLKAYDEESHAQLIVSKQLRFNEEAIIIPNSSDEEIDSLTVANDNQRNFDVNKLDNLHEDEEPSISAGRELKSYFNWGITKGKKKKIKKK